MTICGSGNAAHALAVVASQTLEGDIDWLVGSKDRADLIRRGMSAKGLHSTGMITASADRLRTISSDPAEVIPNTDMVMIAVPAFAHAPVLKRIGPYINDLTVIGCIPARGGFEFEVARLAPRDSGVHRTIFGLQTLPWSTRVRTPGEVVNIGAVKAEVVLAALPAAHGPDIAALLSPILGTQITPSESFLGLTLGNPGQFIHPGLMYGHFRSWRGEEYNEDRIPMFFADATDEMGDIVARLSRDAIAVAREIEAQSAEPLDLQSAVVPVHEWLRSSYSTVTSDTSTVAACFRTGPIQARKAPMIEVRPGKLVPNFGYRYLSEDVPFGLVITRALAEIAGVKTPMIDEVVHWAQPAMQKVYLSGERLQGPDVSSLPIPQNHGISTVPNLIAWYSDEARKVSLPPARRRPL